MSSKVILSTSPAYIAIRAVLGDHRKVFDSLDLAIAAVRTIYSKTVGEGESKALVVPSDFPVVAAKVGSIDLTEDGTIPPLSEWPASYTTEGTRVAVSFIGVRGIETTELNEKGEPKKANGAKGLAIYPLFNVDAINSSESGGDWLWKIIEKEMSHVAFRGVRNVDRNSTLEELSAAALQMPVNVEDYVEESRREAIDSSAFDDTWANFRKLLKGEPSTTLLVEALPQKQEVVKALRSQAYAKENYGDLEQMGAFVFIGNTMVKVIEMANQEAIEKGEATVDAGEIAAWLAKRNEFVFPTQPKKQLAEGQVDFGAFMAKLGG